MPWIQFLSAGRFGTFLNIQHAGIRATKVSTVTQGIGHLQIPCQTSGQQELEQNSAIYWDLLHQACSKMPVSALNEHLSTLF